MLENADSCVKTCLFHFYQLHFKNGAKEDSVLGARPFGVYLPKNFKAFELVTTKLMEE